LFEKVEMKKGASKLAIGDAVQPNGFLFFDHLADVLVLGLA
jgi:hypothetical protein